MSHVKFIAKNTFNKIFKNLAKDFKEDVSKIQLGICFPEGKRKYEAFLELKKQKDIEMESYLGIFDVGIHAIEATIANAGAAYCKELGCKPDEINIIMQYNNGQLPVAVLLKNNQKVRNIDIEKEFLKAA